MAYDAKVFEVMIASPSDVPDLRETVRDVVSEWNNLHSKDKSIILIATGWDSHIAPEFGERPQGIINKRILKDADIVVGIFRHRIGTSTGEAMSGTVEEIQEHTTAEKPALVYFSEEALPQKYDSAQWESLNVFKSWAYTKGIMGKFDSTVDFKTKFQTDLTRTMITHEYITGATDVDFVAIFESAKTHDTESEQAIEMQTSKSNLSDPALKLIMSAIGVENWRLMILRLLSSSTIQAGKIKFGGNSDREFAEYKSAVDELNRKGLIENSGGNGNTYRMTATGYYFLDNL